MACGDDGDDDARSADTTASTEAGSGDGEPAQDLGSVSVALGCVCSDYAPATIGLDQDAWSDLGLEVKNLQLSGGGEVARALAAGEADIGLTGGGGAVSAIVKGLDGRFVAATGLNFSSVVLVVGGDSEAQSVEDLRGGNIGITSFGSVTHFVATRIAESQQWEVDRDIGLVPIGGLSELVAALKAGSIDAFIFPPDPIFALEESGDARVLTTVDEFVGANVQAAIVVRNDLIEERPEVVEAYLAGYFGTVQWMKENRDEAVSALAEVLGLDDNAAGSTYDVVIASDDYSTDGVAPDEAILALADAAAAVDEDLEETPSPDQFWDDRFLPVGP